MKSLRLAASVVFCCFLALVSWVAAPLPAGLIAPVARPALVVLDRHGLPLRVARASDGSLARWVPLADLDPDVIAAFLATEDSRFYRHSGVDGLALARAAWTDLRRRRVVSGGSTIPMHFARLL